MKTRMTINEFVEGYSRGLKASLLTSFKPEGEIHIEDLMVWAVTYGDNVYQFIASMPTEKYEPSSK